MKKFVYATMAILLLASGGKIFWSFSGQAIMTWLDKPEPFREWHIPDNPRDKANYDFAHSIKLPDSMPKPVPFEFIRKDGRKATPKEYFNHLCKTEAGDYIFRTVEDVEGLFQMRVREQVSEKLFKDKYYLEDPWGGNMDELSGVPFSWVSPPWKNYHFFETQGSPSQISSHIPRDPKYPYVSSSMEVENDEVSSGSPFWRYEGYSAKSNKKMKAFPVAELESRYGYTWRGIRRHRDREFGVAGGEIIAIDMRTNEVLGVRRGFSFYRGHWLFGYPCPLKHEWVGGTGDGRDNYTFRFVRKVFKEPIGK